MEADFIRIVLFIAGVILVLGIYFWDMHKRREKTIQAFHRDREFSFDGSVEPETDSDSEPDFQIETDTDQAFAGVTQAGQGVVSEIDPAAERQAEDLRIGLTESIQQTPVQGSPRKRDRDKLWEPPAPKKDRIEAALEELGELVTGRKGLQQEEPTFSEKSRAISSGAQNDMFGFAEEENLREVAEAGVPVMIIQFNIKTRGANFRGADILRCAEEVDLQAGDMYIFHRYEDRAVARHTVFSMASMVEPGFFPLDDMADFSTPGLTLFTQLPGPIDGLAIFADMLFTAERLATMLDGELQDETHSVISKQTIEHIRSQILEHRRKIQLARRRR